MKDGRFDNKFTSLLLGGVKNDYQTKIMSQTTEHNNTELIKTYGCDMFRS